nr:organic solute transporter Ost-alpha [Tanacetum cinerariifolium]
QLKVCIEEVSKRGNDGEGSNGRGRGPRYGPNANYTAKPLKLDFSRFNRKEDPTSWVCRAEQFFRFHATPAVEQVSTATFHLEDDAQWWFQVLMQETPNATWEEFKSGIYATYGLHQFLDYFRELTKLKQQGTIQAYQTQFNKLLAKVGYLPPDRQVSCFISRLSDTVRTEVQANCPTNLSTAISLTRLYEAKNQS